MNSTALTASKVQPGVITARDVRGLLTSFAKPSYHVSLAIFFVDISAFCLCVFLTAYLSNIYLRICAGILEGTVVSFLFLIGHDACHYSFTPSRRLNSVLGRIVFLPSLHSFSLWNLGHNRTHHRYTNLAPYDYAWLPLSRGQFDSLPKWRQNLERIYRSVPGQAFYYIREIWWKKMFFPNRQEVPEFQNAYLWDSVLVTAYFTLLSLGLILVGNHFGSGPLESIFFGWIIPFYVWNWLLNFVVYQQHTHPLVAWHDQKDEWKYVEAQIDACPHIAFPRVVSFVFHNVMEHTAHHALTSIPFYRLRKAQAALESAYPERVQVIDWTLSGYLDAVKRCKLYDYQRHVWQDFEGRDTTPSTITHANRVPNDSSPIQ